MNRYRPRSLSKAYWLWLAGLFGCLGLHRFYLQKNKTAILWLCTAGCFGIGALADLFALRWLVKRHNLLAKMKALQDELEQAKAWKEQFAKSHRFEEAVAKRNKEEALMQEIALLKQQLQPLTHNP